VLLLLLLLLAAVLWREGRVQAMALACQCLFVLLYTATLPAVLLG
jgi:hypothetical protein